MAQPFAEQDADVLRAMHPRDVICRVAGPKGRRHFGVTRLMDRAGQGEGAADAYAVMGNPVAHSRSPFIHAEFARQVGHAIAFTLCHVEISRFREAVGEFRAGGGRGASVTLPFKEEAHALSGQRTARAERAGAVNTLGFDGDRIWGDNTDGAGLVRDLERNLGVTLAGRGILLLGAGGAARGVIGPLLEASPARLVVANRTASRAEALRRHFGDGIEACGLDRLPAARFDLIVNATSASLSGETPPVPAALLRPGGVAYDMMYAARPSPFMRWAESAGASVAADGAGMLVEQAAEAFRLWRGVRPRTGPVIDALRRRLLE